MGIYSLTLLILVILYGGTTILVGAVQLKQRMISKLSSIMMIIGGLLTILSSFRETILGYNIIYLLISGLILIHISAISNGLKMYGKINKKHHIVRLFISILIIIIFLLK